MPDQLDKLFNEIDELLEGSENEDTDLEVRGAPTAQFIRRPEDVDEALIASFTDNRQSMIQHQVNGWQPRVSAYKTEDHEYEKVVSAATRIYGVQGRLIDIADLLGISMSQLNRMRESERYFTIVRARLEAVGREGLKDRAKRWINIAHTYARYYRIPTKKIKQILNGIDPLILA